MPAVVMKVLENDVDIVLIPYGEITITTHFLIGHLFTEEPRLRAPLNPPYTSCWRQRVQTYSHGYSIKLMTDSISNLLAKGYYLREVKTCRSNIRSLILRFSKKVPHEIDNYGGVCL